MLDSLRLGLMCRSQSAFTLGLTAILALTSTVLAPVPAPAQLPPGSTVPNEMGVEVTIGDWGLEWWDWILSFHAASSPATDVNGARQNRGQVGPVFNLCAAAGAASGFATRTFAVPENKHLLVAMATVGSIPTEGEDPVAHCQGSLDLLLNTTFLSFSLNGASTSSQDLFDHLESTSINSFGTVTVGAGNPWDIAPGAWPGSCSNGYFVMLEPLSLGQHTVQCGFSDPIAGAFLSHTNYITVVSPELLYEGHIESAASPQIGELTNVQGIAMSGDGRHLYAVSDFNDSIAAFDVSGSTGELTLVEVEKDGLELDGAQGVAVSPELAPNTSHVYVASATDDAVVVFDRDTLTGELTFVEFQRDLVGDVSGLDGATAVSVAPDGRHVYAVGRLSDAVVSFERDLTTGALTFVDALHDNAARSLDGAKAIAVSPDDKHVYVAASVENAIAVLARDGTTGALSYLGAAIDGVSGVEGIREPSSIALDPSGDHLYVASTFDDALAVFQRNATTGALTFVEFHQADTNRTPGLLGAHSVAVSPGGEYVYAVSTIDEALTLFGRDPGTGALSLIDVISNQAYGVTGMAGPRGLALSPSGAHVYVGGSSDGALTRVLPEPNVFSMLLPGLALIAALRRHSRRCGLGEGRTS